MKSANLLPMLCVLLAPALAVAAEDVGEVAARRSLDLSLPRGALVETPSPASAGTAAPLPDLGGPRMGNAGLSPRGARQRADLPYGAGYEARQGGGSTGGQGRGRGRGR